MDTSDLSRKELCIIGLGLMGGSLALDLHGKVERLTALDQDSSVVDAALAAGVIDGIDGPETADIVVLAVPAHHIVELLPTLSFKTGALVIDLGSTKGEICAAMDDLPETVLAVGGHPMCGLAENGYVNATAGLYREATFVLCPTARTTSQARVLAESLVQAIGANALWMERGQHDYLTGLVSHLPHLLSFALMQMAMEAADKDQRVWELTGGGFKGATRLSRTNAAMITGMFSTNSRQLRTLLTQMRQSLDLLDSLLDDTDRLRPLLEEIVAARRAYSNRYEKE